MKKKNNETKHKGGLYSAPSFSLLPTPLLDPLPIPLLFFFVCPQSTQKP